jgi:hypothetical protein
MGDITRRDVRVPDTVPDISGTWTSLSSNRTIAPLDGDATPFLPWAQAYFDQRAKAEAAGQPLFDPNASCLPSGVPRTISVPYPFDIVQTPDVIMIGVEVMHTYRMIHMDGKPPPPDYKPSFLGYSVGHWDGDTLVVETTNFPQAQAFNGSWKNLKITERFTRTAKDRLRYKFTVSDPDTWAEPWSGEYEFSPLHGIIYEYACHEGNYALPGILAGGLKAEQAPAAQAVAAKQPGS